MDIKRERYRYVMFNAMPTIITLLIIVITIKIRFQTNKLDLVLFSHSALLIIIRLLVEYRWSKYFIVRIPKTVDNIRRFKNFSGDSYMVKENQDTIHNIKSFCSVNPVVFTLDESDKYYELLAPRGIKSILKSYDIRDGILSKHEN